MPKNTIVQRPWVAMTLPSDRIGPEGEVRITHICLKPQAPHSSLWAAGYLGVDQTDYWSNRTETQREPFLWRSTDGGEHWQDYYPRMATTAEIGEDRLYAEPPKLADATYAALAVPEAGMVRVVLQLGEPLLMASDDSGVHWRFSRPWPPLGLNWLAPGQPYAIWRSARDGYIALPVFASSERAPATDTLYGETEDGGRTWMPTTRAEWEWISEQPPLPGLSPATCLGWGQSLVGIDASIWRVNWWRERAGGRENVLRSITIQKIEQDPKGVTVTDIILPRYWKRAPDGAIEFNDPFWDMPD